MIKTRYYPWDILNETQTGWRIDLSVENLIDSLRNAMAMDAEELYAMGQRASLLVS